MLKQGGKFRINGIVIDTKPTEILLTSRGEKDIKPIVAPGCDDRF